MNAEKKLQIRSVWEAEESANPDKSTEYLLAVVAQICRCDVGDVCEALAPEEQE
jgi:hypothetical protein